MLLTLLMKDLKIELRVKTAITFIVSLSLILTVIIAVGVNSAFLGRYEVRKLFPTLIWIVFFLTSTIILSRSFDYEFENRAIDGLLLAGVSPSLFYLSKVLSNFLLTFIGHIVSLVSLSLLLNIEVLHLIPELALLSVMVLLPFSAISSIVIYISASSKLRSLLLPLLLLPMLFPCFFAAIELSHMVFFTAELDLSSFWVSLLAGLAVIYLAVGINVYPLLVDPD